jgi:hypothetical protein
MQLKAIILKNAKEMIDPRHMLSVPFELLRFVSDLRRFKTSYKGSYAIRLLPVLFERTAKSSFDPHYVYQAVWAARHILQENRPDTHVDISSHVPFVIQLSASVTVIQLEFRPPLIRLPSYKAIAGNILDLPFKNQSIQSLSCLHVVEHIGLARYGDPIDCQGAWCGLKELQRVIGPGGSLYLSVPVGKPLINFNAGYTFRAEDIRDVLTQLMLVEFSYVSDKRSLQHHRPLAETSSMQYALGLFHFKRPT